MNGGGVQRRRLAIGSERAAAARQHALDRAFQVGQRPRTAVQGGHVLVLGFEGDGVAPWLGSVLLGLVQPGLARRHQQRALGRVAVDLPALVAVPQQRVVAQQAGAQQLKQGRVLRRINHQPSVAKSALGRVADAVELEYFAAGRQRLHRHFVARQRAGFVGADDGGAAQRLHRRQAADDGVALGHARHANGQRDRQHHRQPFGDHRHRQRHRRQEQVDPRLTVPQADQKGERRQAQDGDQQQPAETGDLARQRRGQQLGAGDQLGDAADLGVLAGGGDHATAAAIDHQGAGISHVDALGQRRISRYWAAAFVHRQRLAGQRRFFDAQIACVQQPQIGRHLVARGQQHDVARHQLARVDALPLAAAQHGGLGGQRARQRIERHQRLGFLHKTNHGVEKHDAENDGSVDPGAHEELDQHRRKQDVDQRLVELQQKPHKRALAPAHRQGIGAIERPAARPLGLIQSLRRIGGQLSQHIVLRQRMPLTWLVDFHGA